jgi:metal-dependent amidase/aminoacylase/carboxypeptidase family protein
MPAFQTPDSSSGFNLDVLQTSGAKPMLEDGLFERFPCDSFFGMHNRPDLPIGKFAIRPAPMMAGGAFFDITTRAKLNGARPNPRYVSHIQQ